MIFMEARDKQDIDHVAIIRMEQLYPLATKPQLILHSRKNTLTLNGFGPKKNPVIWGAWAFVQDNLGETFNLDVIARV